MTTEQIKELVLWMRSEGVSQFVVDKVSVAFHPKAIELPGRVTMVNQDQDIAPRDGGLSVEDILPPKRIHTGNHGT